MRRDQLQHAIRAARQITGQLEVIVVGSQAILGTYPEYELPSAATSSLEVDILPITDDNNDTVQASCQASSHRGIVPSPASRRPATPAAPAAGRRLESAE